ncbi:MAG: hypothetical protein V3W14_05500 [Candidatus Neomarinimicrobiota bacterium]
MAAFVDGCTLEAVEAVCHVEHLDILDGVTSLVEKSLMRQRDSGGEPRFLMLETIREYGIERLKDGNEYRQTFERHLQFFVSFSIRMEPKLKGEEQVEALRWLRADHNNIRAAVERALGAELNSPEKVLELVSALRFYFVIQGHVSEEFQWLEPALQAVPQAPIQLRAKALNPIGTFATLMLNDKAQDYLREGRWFEPERSRSFGRAETVESARGRTRPSNPRYRGQAPFFWITLMKAPCQLLSM